MNLSCKGGFQSRVDQQAVSSLGMELEREKHSSIHLGIISKEVILKLREVIGLQKS